MPKFAIITDTASSIPDDVAAQNDIHQVPIVILFGSQEYKSNEEINDQQVFERINREGKLPTTSAPAPGAYLEAFRAAFARGADEVICYCVSGKVSATYAAAVNARDAMPDRKVTIVDSRSLTLGQGFMALEAAKAAASGASREEIVQRSISVGEHSHLFASLATLKYLAMSGRVGQLAAGMANLLSIKPIVTFQDGKLEMVERVRTQSKAWMRTIELSKQAVAGRTITQMGIIHVCAREAASAFEELLRKHLVCPAEVLIAELTPGLSVHSGPGFVGVVFVTQGA